MRYRVTNLTRNTLLADRAERADTFWRRFKGLQLVREFPMGSGLHLVPCSSIHMFFMRFPIDVLFLDRAGAVVEVLHALAPWRVSRVYLEAHSALELPAGTAKASGTSVGDQIGFSSEG